jgi:hypothetical protein
MKALPIIANRIQLYYCAEYAAVSSHKENFVTSIMVKFGIHKGYKLYYR